MEFFFFKQKTAYEIYQCDWSSDVCSSDLPFAGGLVSCALEYRYGYGNGNTLRRSDTNREFGRHNSACT